MFLLILNFSKFDLKLNNMPPEFGILINLKFHFFLNFSILNNNFYFIIFTRILKLNQKKQNINLNIVKIIQNINLILYNLIWNIYKN